MAAISTCTVKYVIDRIEGGHAMLENAQTLDIVSLPEEELPSGAKPGHTLVNMGGKWQIDHEDTEARRERISEKFARLKGRAGR